MADPKMKFLVVDDFATMRRIVRGLLKELGFNNVDEAEDGVVALAKLKSESFDFVVSDWNMPNMTGIELLRAIRADDTLGNTPFILTEASFECEDINLAHQAGADAFILKPFDMSVLKAKLKQVINRKPRKREAPLAAESTLSVDFPMLGKF